MAMTRASTPFTGIDPGVVRDADLVRYADRILFGSDFPNLPTLRGGAARPLGPRPADDVYRRIFRDNARAFFGIGS